MLRSAWIRVTRWPAAPTARASRSARRLVRVNTSVGPPSAPSSLSRSDVLSSPRAAYRRSVTPATGVATAPTSIRSGRLRCRRTSRSTAAGIVAEKQSVWRSIGTRARIPSTCGANPMSSMRSASSRTSSRIPPSETEPRSRWSMSRPGVATTTSGRLRSPLVCGPIGSPPTTVTTRRRPVPRARSASAIWLASSRVGASTSPRRPVPWPANRSIMGMTNAAVLPVPV